MKWDSCIFFSRFDRREIQSLNGLAGGMDILFKFQSISHIVPIALDSVNRIFHTIFTVTHTQTTALQGHSEVQPFSIQIFLTAPPGPLSESQS